MKIGFGGKAHVSSSCETCMRAPLRSRTDQRERSIAQYRYHQTTWFVSRLVRPSGPDEPESTLTSRSPGAEAGRGSGGSGRRAGRLPRSCVAGCRQLPIGRCQREEDPETLAPPQGHPPEFRGTSAGIPSESGTVAGYGLEDSCSLLLPAAARGLLPTRSAGRSGTIFKTGGGALSSRAGRESRGFLRSTGYTPPPTWPRRSCAILLHASLSFVYLGLTLEDWQFQLPPLNH